MKKIVVNYDDKISQNTKKIRLNSKKVEELDKSFIMATTLLNVISTSNKELKFETDDSSINYLPPLYVEYLREFIIGMYQGSEDPIVRGYNSKSNLNFIMGFVKNVYNEYRSKREKLIWKAAYIFYNLNSKHPFTDGNKRTALITCNSFLEYNGYSIGSLPYRSSYDFIKEVAKGNKTLEECFGFIQNEVSIFKISTKAKERTALLLEQMKSKIKKGKKD